MDGAQENCSCYLERRLGLEDFPAGSWRKADGARFMRIAGSCFISAVLFSVLFKSELIY